MEDSELIKIIEIANAERIKRVLLNEFGHGKSSRINHTAYRLLVLEIRKDMLNIDGKDTLMMLYDRYVKPLETEHEDEWIALSYDGDCVLGSTRPGVSEEFYEQYKDKKHTIFQIGKRRGTLD